jgi:hypothetical protein
VTDEKVLAAVEAGPKLKHREEAAWLIENGGLVGTLSKPARAAFELGIALASGAPHRAWTASPQYAEAMAKVGATAPRAAARPAAAATVTEFVGVSSTTIRDWARDNGYQVSERGRISEDIKTAYAQAQVGKPAEQPAAEPASQASGAAASAAERRAARLAKQQSGKAVTRKDPAHATAPKQRTTAQATVTPPKPSPRRGRNTVQAGETSF